MRLFMAVMLMLSASVRPAVAQMPGPATTPLDRTIHVTVNGAPIVERDLANLVHALYDAGTKQVDTVKKHPTEMPSQSPYVYYAGRNVATGREIVWESTVAASESDAKRMNDEYTAAYALAALDAGYVGEPWRSLYRDSVKDDASRLAFGEQIARAFNDASDQQKNAADTDIAWLRKHIAIATSRKDVYSALRSDGLVAYNYDYAPGTPIRRGNMTGCDTSDEINQLAAAWPYPGKPLPKRSGGCAAIMGRSKPEQFPSAYMALPTGFTIACSSEIHVTMTFGPGDLLKKMDISKPQWLCV